MTRATFIDRGRKAATDYCDICHSYFQYGDKFILFQCSDNDCGDHFFHAECYAKKNKITVQDLKNEHCVIFTWKLHRPMTDNDTEGAWICLDD